MTFLQVKRRNILLSLGFFVVILAIFLLTAFPGESTGTYRVPVNSNVGLILSLSLYIVPMLLGLFFARKSVRLKESAWAGKLLFTLWTLILLGFVCFVAFSFAILGA